MTVYDCGLSGVIEKVLMVKEAFSALIVTCKKNNGAACICTQTHHMVTQVILSFSSSIQYFNMRGVYTNLNVLIIDLFNLNILSAHQG